MKKVSNSKFLLSGIYIVIAISLLFLYEGIKQNGKTIKSKPINVAPSTICYPEDTVLISNVPCEKA